MRVTVSPLVAIVAILALFVLGLVALFRIFGPARGPGRLPGMRWPFEKRVEPTHAWGALSLGAVGLIGIPTVLATLHATESSFRWWWPTNWMIVPLVIFVVGLALLFLPVRRSQLAEPIPSRPLAARPAPATIAPAKMSRMSAPQGSAATLETLRDLIMEGKAMQARIADRRGLFTKIPDDLQKSSAAWKTKVSAALTSQPGMLAQFEGDPIRIPLAVQGPTGMIYDKIEQGIRVLEVIKQDLGEPV